MTTVGDGPTAPRIPAPRAPLEGEEFVEAPDEASTVLMPKVGPEPVIDLGAPEQRDLAESHELLPSLPDDDEPRHRRWWLVAVPVVVMLFIAVIAAAWHLSGNPDDPPGPDPTPPVALPTGPVDPDAPTSPGAANIAPGGSATASGSRRPNTSATPGGGGTTFTPGPPVAPTPGPPLPVKNSAGRCVESGDGGRVALDFCGSEANQQWQENGGTLTSQGRCLSLNDGDTASGTRVETAECTGDASQQWQKRADGTWVNAKSNRCLDTELNSTLPGARLIIADCKGSTSQRWTMG
ncbi:RICIN domain-containing protein [Virgisporangium aliadipatigenens]|uniref:RICIN domain-containing protein n=1 Tax=Virgisporangium aliadipatigenens TaxID=741659 RepID=UPI001941B1DA|nr:RICIN domain-containing protein [Virgisporangium aliadipatigenens]